jgi:hypothetical protein
MQGAGRDVDEPFDQLRACPCPPENPNYGCMADVSLIDSTPTIGPGEGEEWSTELEGPPPP